MTAMTAKLFSRGWTVSIGVFFSMKAFGGHMTYFVTQNPEVCHEVHVGRFTLPEKAAFLNNGVGNIGVSTGYCHPQVRSAGESDLYVGAVCLRPYWYPAPEKYAVDLSGRKGVRRISEEKWQSGVPLTWSENGLFPKPQESAVEYKGQRLARSGPRWEGIGGTGPLRTHLSWNATRAAVNSWSGFQVTYSFLDPTSFGKRDKVEGQYWVDIYETASGRPLVRIQGSFHGAAPSVFQTQAAWYSDRIFVMPVGGTLWSEYEFNLRRLLICDVDAAARKGETVLKERK
jgi:hypothetical protein